MTFDKNKLKGTSFISALPISARRLVVAVFGPTDSGKTTFACSGPGPILYQGIDQGHEGVVDRLMAEGKDIHPAIYTVPNSMRGPKETSQAFCDRIMNESGKTWKQWDVDYQAAIDSGCGTVVWDTGDEIFNVLTLSLFGRTSKIMPRDRGIIYQTYSSRVREAMKTKDTSLIILHKQKEIWANNEPTGKHTLAGYRDTDYLVPVIVQLGKKGTGAKRVFTLKVVKCRYNMGLEGEVFEGIGFPELAAMVLPDVPAEVWYR
jgi:hypothetical protein